MKFFQVNKASWPQVEIMMNRQCPKALDIWWHLVPLANALGIVCIGQSDIKKFIHVKSRTTVNRAINYMADRKILIKGRKGVQNIYILNYHLMKETPYNKTKHILKGKGIVFPANVVITKTNERHFYDEFKALIANNKTGRINLNKVKFNKINRGGHATKNGEKIKHRNGASKARAKAKAKRDKKRGWTTDRKEAKRLGIGYQTKIQFDKNKKPVKSNN